MSDNLMAVIPIAQIVYPDGSNVEGKGVEPDHVVSLHRKDLLIGVDAQLAAAIELLKGLGLPNNMIGDD